MRTNNFGILSLQGVRGQVELLAQGPSDPRLYPDARLQDPKVLRNWYYHEALSY